MKEKTPRETLLLVDDEPSIRRMAARILSGEGYVVLEASNGREGLAMIVRDTLRLIQILVTDIVMPVMSGVKLAESTWLARPELKILFISGYADDFISDPSVAAAGIPLLRKPFTPEELCGHVRGVLDRAATNAS